VRGIASGRLERAVFQHYVAQDAFFLEAFARAYALCVARAPDRETMRAFKRLLDAVDDELKLHHSYAERWEVDLVTVPTEATRAYTDFLLRVASLESPAHAAAAMAPCMRLYAWLGQQLKPVALRDSPYYEWVETYSSDEFDAHAAALEALLDRLAGDESALYGHYSTAMRLELAFFESSVASR
jgi:thiaminase/transcriptional activator TenA